MFPESRSPGQSRLLLPEIHRLTVLQMSDLKSCVLNQDCGTQQQKMAASGEGGGGVGGKQSSGHVLDVSTPRKEPPTVERIRDKTLHLTPCCLPFMGGAVSICHWPTSWWTPYPTWGPHLRPQARLGRQPPPLACPLHVVCGSAPSATSKE